MQTSLFSFDSASKDIDEQIRKCQKCELWKTRKNAVPGEGGFRKKVMFVGEAPGKWEDIKGRPFVGAAGKYLDELLSSIGLSRDDVFITNIVKCRPPNNRDPTSEEISACAPYLEWQIETMAPRIICPLGRFSAKFILEKFGFTMKSISAAQGKIHRGTITIIPMYHPAAALYHGKWKAELEKSFTVLKEELEGIEK
uniref:Type-4 uracil-DNA glycosylase n=1 Tax=uncultured euryarchaeote Alv-FOS1 TaxID=337892 RepID=Q3SAA1_9EURY|nr:uracyl DNA glycosylase [uncultured euryarchaeote Alv-FOS1]